MKKYEVSPAIGMRAPTLDEFISCDNAIGEAICELYNFKRKTFAAALAEVQNSDNTDLWLDLAQKVSVPNWLAIGAHALGCRQSTA